MSRSFRIALVASILLLTVAVGGLGAYLFLEKGTSAAAASSAAEQAAATAPTAAAFYKLSNFVTDLSDRDRVRYVDVTVALGMKDENAVTAAKKVEPQIRDLILGRLRVLTAADLSGAKGKEQLANSLQEALSGVLKDSLVKVYVTDLTVQ